MKGVSSIYEWRGGPSVPRHERPECSKKTHAALIEGSGRMLFDARKAAYEWYCKECRAWGRDPASEDNWFMHAKAAYCRLQRGGK
jgi:hypothetical protein